MIANCAWCHRELHPEDGREPVGATSDGICDECRSRYFPGAPVSLPPAGHLRRAMERTGYARAMAPASEPRAGGEA
jgi:hypothetical protein